jgi:hypothetical protein
MLTSAARANDPALRWLLDQVLWGLQQSSRFVIFSEAREQVRVRRKTRTAFEPECLEGGLPQSLLIVIRIAGELDDLAGDELHDWIGPVGQAELTTDLVKHEAHGSDRFGLKKSTFGYQRHRDDTLPVLDTTARWPYCVHFPRCRPAPP